ncbi:MULTISPECIES: hypothetical protein [unclassified Cryobacterium]|uniref:hypothetical protein n=1 Tax=unclassified Cryobacterium TaxID=2649013 RepID=UPI0010699901|nr:MULTISPECIES: hypothetical protein [unclassified Cryobacterium]TFC60770.1 hypothetical protein E3O60_05575 [Cryobacterium sp. TMB1-7]TFC92267.1 hypothetical protein E3T19_02150 [Cryobacterium sp. TMT4-31]
MPTTDPASQAAADHSSAPTGAPTSADRLIAAIESINDVDVANSPEPDRAAVLELIDIINDEQRSSLLFALLLERIRTGA